MNPAIYSWVFGTLTFIYGLNVGAAEHDWQRGAFWVAVSCAQFICASANGRPNH